MGTSDGSVDILMVEDNRNDEELTLHELRKYHLANSIHVVRDGQEALDYIFCTGR
jgi:two-component system, response regulator